MIELRPVTDCLGTRQNKLVTNRWFAWSEWSHHADSLKTSNGLQRLVLDIMSLHDYCSPLFKTSNMSLSFVIEYQTYHARSADLSNIPRWCSNGCLCANHFTAIGEHSHADKWEAVKVSCKCRGIDCFLCSGILCIFLIH